MVIYFLSVNDRIKVTFTPNLVGKCDLRNRPE